MNAPLIFGHDDKSFYIAVCEYSYGVHKVPAMAITIAQERIQEKWQEKQLLIYESANFIEPKGWKHGAPVWPDGKPRKRAREAAGSAFLDEPKLPRLVGLTTTHRGWKQRPR